MSTDKIQIITPNDNIRGGGEPRKGPLRMNKQDGGIPPKTPKPKPKN